MGLQDAAIAGHQVREASAAGFDLHAYTYLYWTRPIVSQINRAIKTILSYPIRRLWLDVEEESHGVHMINTIRRAVDTLEDMPTGIYTRRRAWLTITGDTAAFSHLPLWDAFWGKEDIEIFLPYGGWERCEMRQHTADVMLEGVLCDLNVYRKGF